MKKKLYFGHSTSYDYAKMYEKLQASSLATDYELILPYVKKPLNSADFYTHLALFVAEVSAPATGLGIEIGWAYDRKVPIVCVFAKGAKISSSLQTVSKDFIEYENIDDMVNKLIVFVKARLG